MERCCMPECTLSPCVVSSDRSSVRCPAAIFSNFLDSKLNIWVGVHLKLIFLSLLIVIIFKSHHSKCYICLRKWVLLNIVFLKSVIFVQSDKSKVLYLYEILYLCKVLYCRMQIAQRVKLFSLTGKVNSTAPSTDLGV